MEDVTIVGRTHLDIVYRGNIPKLDNAEVSLPIADITTSGMAAFAAMTCSVLKQSCKLFTVLSNDQFAKFQLCQLAAFEGLYLIPTISEQPTSFAAVFIDQQSNRSIVSASPRKDYWPNVSKVGPSKIIHVGGLPLCGPEFHSLRRMAPFITWDPGDISFRIDAELACSRGRPDLTFVSPGQLLSTELVGVLKDSGSSLVVKYNDHVELVTSTSTVAFGFERLLGGDSTGAGDVLAGAIVACLAKDMSLNDSVSFGVTAASIFVRAEASSRINRLEYLRQCTSP